MHYYAKLSVQRMGVYFLVIIYYVYEAENSSIYLSVHPSDHHTDISGVSAAIETGLA